MVTGEQVAEGLERVGAAGRAVCLHVSLRSFGGIREGPETLLDGCRKTGSTLLSPSFSGSLFEVPPPSWDRPGQNGREYDDGSHAEADLDAIYTLDRVEVDEWLGATARYVAAHRDRVRGASPGCSWSAIGPLAAHLVGRTIEDDDFGPLRRLVALNGVVVLMGVSLTSLTLVHLAEVEAGRRPFIFWAKAQDGRVVRTRGGRCSRGFDRLSGALAHLERRTSVGRSRWRAYPAAGALEAAVAAIRADGEITRCATPGCIECRDAIAGGPVE